MFLAYSHFDNFFVTHGHIPSIFNLLDLTLSELSHSQSPQHSKTYKTNKKSKHYCFTIEHHQSPFLVLLLNPRIPAQMCRSKLSIQGCPVPEGHYWSNVDNKSPQSSCLAQLTELNKHTTHRFHTAHCSSQCTVCSVHHIVCSVHYMVCSAGVLIVAALQAQ